MGFSASSVIRDAMRAYSNFGPMARLPGSPFMVLSSFAGAAAGGLALSLFLSTDDGAEPVELATYGGFYSLDLNGDRMVTLEEYHQTYGHFRTVIERQHRLEGESATQVETSLIVEALEMVFDDQNVDERQFNLAPEHIGDACWQAADAVYQQEIDANFAILDLNGDGRVRPSEYGQYYTDELTVTFRDYDLDSDGVLSTADIINGYVDVNSSRQVSYPEVEPVHVVLCREDVGPSRQGQNSPDGQEPITVEMAQLLLSSMDLDGDSVVSLSEFITVASN
jgi:hypothetical protein